MNASDGNSVADWAQSPVTVIGVVGVVGVVVVGAVGDDDVPPHAAAR